MRKLLLSLLVASNFSLAYDYVGEFSEGLAVVGKIEQDKNVFLYGYIDKTGKEIIPLQYEAGNDIDWDWNLGFKEGLALVQNQKNEKWGFIDKTGKIVIPIQYDYAESFIDGLAIVEKNGKKGIIDKTGKFIVPLQYAEIKNFSEGLARVREYDGEDGGFFGFIDKTGNLVISMKYNLASSFKDGIASVMEYEYPNNDTNKDGIEKWFLIDTTGKVIKELK